MELSGRPRPQTPRSSLRWRRPGSRRSTSLAEGERVARDAGRKAQLEQPARELRKARSCRAVASRRSRPSRPPTRRRTSAPDRIRRGRESQSSRVGALARGGRLRDRGAASHRRRRRAARRAGRHARGLELHRRRRRRRADAALESRGVLAFPAPAARARRRLVGLDGDDRARDAGLDAGARRADGVPADRPRGGRGRDGARRRRRRDAHVRLDRRDRDAGRDRRGGARVRRAGSRSTSSAIAG